MQVPAPRTALSMSSSSTTSCVTTTSSTPGAHLGGRDAAGRAVQVASLPRESKARRCLFPLQEAGAGGAGAKPVDPTDKPAALIDHCLEALDRTEVSGLCAALAGDAREQLVRAWVERMQAGPASPVPGRMADIAEGIRLSFGQDAAAAKRFVRLMVPAIFASHPVRPEPPLDPSEVAESLRQMVLQVAWAAGGAGMDDSVAREFVRMAMPTAAPAGDARAWLRDHEAACLVAFIARGIGAGARPARPALIIDALRAAPAAMPVGRIAWMLAAAASALPEGSHDAQALWEILRERIKRATHARPGGPPGSPPADFSGAQLELVDRLEQVQAVLHDLDKWAMTASQAEGARRQLQAAVRELGKPLAVPGPAESKGHGATAGAQVPAAFASFLARCIGKAAAAPADVRRACRAWALRHGGLDMPDATRDACLDRWFEIASKAGDTATRDQLGAALRGFSQAVRPIPDEAPDYARAVISRVLALQPAHLGGEEGRAELTHMCAVLRLAFIGLDAPFSSGSRLRQLLDLAFRRGHPPPGADRFAGPDRLTAAMAGWLLTNVADVVSARVRLADDHLRAFVDLILSDTTDAYRQAGLMEGLVRALARCGMADDALPGLLQRITADERLDPSGRALLLESIVQDQAAAKVRSDGRLLPLAACLGPAQLARLASGCWQPSRLDEEEGQALGRIVTRLARLAPALDARRWTWLACGYGLSMNYPDLPQAALASRQVALAAVAPEDLPVSRREAFLRGLTMARDPLGVIGDASLPQAEQLALLDGMFQMPGMLTRFTAPVILGDLLALDLPPPQRREAVASLVLHGAAFLPLASFATTRLAMTMQLMKLLAGSETPPPAVETKQSRPATPVMPAETDLPQPVFDEYLGALSYLAAMYETLPGARNLAFVFETPLDLAQARARRADIVALRDFLRAELRQVGSLGEPPMLAQALRAAMRTQIEPLERAEEAVRAANNRPAVAGGKPETKGTSKG